MQEFLDRDFKGTTGCGLFYDQQPTSLTSLKANGGFERKSFCNLVRVNFSNFHTVTYLEWLAASILQQHVLHFLEGKGSST